MTRVLPRPAALAITACAALAFAQLGVGVVSMAQQAGLPWLWWASRSLGLVAYLAMALSMLFGALITSRGLDSVMPRKVVLDLHQQWTLAAVIGTALHVLTVVLHAESDISVVGALVPFATTTLTGPLALGVVGMWGLLVLALSSWLQKRIRYGLWRGIHGLSFGAFLLAALHSITAGTDTANPIVQWMYLATLAVVCGSIAYRVLLTQSARSPAQR